MKVLVAGVGSIGQRHIRNLRTRFGDDVDILAYRVRKLPHVLTEALSIEPDRSVDEKYGLRVYDDLDQALARRPDVTFVCNPTGAHMAVALAAARAGCHVFIEKPLSHNCEGIDELIGIVSRKRLVATVGYQMRFHPGLGLVRSLLERQAIGRVVAVRAEVGEYLPAAHPYEDYRVSYAGRASLGGGVVLSQSHELDYLYWLFGAPQRIFAVGGQLSDLDIDVEDTASVLMECVVDGRPVPVHVSQDFVQRPATRMLQIVGSHGKVLLDFERATLVVSDASGAAIETATFAHLTRNQLFVDELNHFLSCVRGVQTPLVSLRDAAEVLRIGLAARESIRTRHPVTFA